MALATNTMIKDQSLLRHEDIKQHIQILPELAAYIPPLLAEEYNQLEENIKLNGCREALLVWEMNGDLILNQASRLPVYILVDGHNRYAICKKYNLDFKVHLMNFSSIEEVKFFMIDNQLGRRNLAPEQVSYLRGLRYLREKQEKGKYLRDDQKGQNDPFDLSHAEVTSTAIPVEATEKEESRETTAHRLGKQFNVSEKTIKRDSTYAKGLELLTSDFRQDILSGKSKVDKGLIQQLGKSLNNHEDLIPNLADLERVLQHAGLKSQNSIDSGKVDQGEKAIQLKKQLYQLVSQLETNSSSLKKICNEIIECARQLKEQG